MNLQPSLEQQTYQSIIEQRQWRFVFYVSLIGLIGTSIDGIVNVVSGHGLQDLVVIIPIVGIFVILLALLAFKKMRPAIVLFMIVCILGLLYGTFTDMNANSGGRWGLYFMFLFPLISSFLFGKRAGFRWTSGLLAFLVILLLFHVNELLPSPYSFDTLRNFFLAYVEITIMVYSYQDLIEASEKLIQSRDQQLAKERDQAKTVVTSIGEGLFVVDSRNKIISVNPTAERLLGLSSDSMLNQPITSIFTLVKHDTPVTGKDYPALHPFTTHEVTVVNLDDKLYCRSQQGRLFPISLVASPLIEGGKVTGVVVAFRDITTDREAEAFIEREVKKRTREVREGDARLLASINSLNIGFIMTNHQPAIVLRNNAANAILTKADLVALPNQTADSSQHIFTLRSLDEKLGPEADFLAKVKQSLQKQQEVKIDNLIYNNVFLQIYISPIILEKSVIGTVILIQDITEERVLERSKDELFSIASHELRTPLTAIRSYAALMDTKYKKDLKNDNLEAMVAGIHHSAVRLIDIVNDFLDTSRLEQRRISFNTSQFDVVPVIEQVAADYSALAKEKHIKLTFKKPAASLPNAYADVERIKQVLINLVGNAIKFTGKGEVTITIAQEDTMLAIHVADTGKGILPENKTLLFRKFQQAGHDIITRDASRGTGLGLYISKLLIESMGGKIWLVSTIIGKGSVFAFSIPVAKKTK